MFTSTAVESLKRGQRSQRKAFIALAFKEIFQKVFSHAHKIINRNVILNYIMQNLNIQLF